jgi:hypothetical protein
MKADMLHCQHCVQMAKHHHRNAKRVRRLAATFAQSPSRDSMFFIAGKESGLALALMAEARANHTDQSSAYMRRYIMRSVA